MVLKNLQKRCFPIISIVLTTLPNEIGFSLMLKLGLLIAPFFIKTLDIV